jgi:hypothetical protein
MPGEAGTAVRMVAETVTLEVFANPRTEGGASAKTHAVFTMHNLGHVDETMAVRFPLSFPDGSSDGSYEFPEISSIAVKIDGQPVKTSRESRRSMLGYRERDEIPCCLRAAFPAFGGRWNHYA